MAGTSYLFSSPVKALLPPTQVSVGVLVAIIWIFFGLATVSIMFRLASRLAVLNRLQVDDWCVLLGWLLYFGWSGMATAEAPLALKFQKAIGGDLPLWDGWINDSRKHGIYRITADMLWLHALTMVKLSLLLFFRKLGRGTNDRFRRIYWWATVGVLVAGYAGGITIELLYCRAESTFVCTTPKRLRYALIAIKFSFAADIGTDAMILLIPVYTLWGLQLDMRRKIGILSSLCAGVVVVGISFGRGAATNWGRNAALDRILLWSSVELGVALIVCSSACYKMYCTERKRLRSANNTLTSGGGTGGGGLGSRTYASRTNSNVTSQRNLQLHFSKTPSEKAYFSADWSDIGSRATSLRNEPLPPAAAGNLAPPVPPKPVSYIRSPRTGSYRSFIGSSISTHPKDRWI